MQAKVTRTPIEINGVKIGETTTIGHIDGEPECGRCFAIDCPEIATKETLIGLHFCESHFGRFYTTENFPFDTRRERDYATKNYESQIR